MRMSRILTRHIITCFFFIVRCYITSTASAPAGKSSSDPHKNGTCPCECNPTEHGNEEHHISRHAIVWPSAFAMMIVIALAGLFFYRVYSRVQMKKFLKSLKEHQGKTKLFEQVVLSSTVTGAAAPAMLAFTESEKNAGKKNLKDQECDNTGHMILQQFSITEKTSK